MTSLVETGDFGPRLERPVAFGYVSMLEPDEEEIANLRRRIGVHCRKRGFHLATVFCDRGFEPTDMARPGFAGLLDAVWPSSGNASVFVPDHEHLSDDPLIREAMEEALKRQGVVAVELLPAVPASSRADDADGAA